MGMNQREFADLHNVSLSTVSDWFDKGYLPGATKDEHGVLSILEGTLKPDTKARARTDDKIRLRIVEACNKQLSVFPELYRVSPERFELYIKQLIQIGYIEPYTTSHGFTQYATTAKGSDSLKLSITEQIKAISSCLQPLVEGVVRGSMPTGYQ